VTESPRTDARVAVVLDAVALVAFVALGRTNHHLHGSGGWFITVLWPFVVGWFAAALATGVYAARSAPWRRAVATCVLGVPLALVLRATVAGRSTPVVFGVVAFVFISLTTLGWRAVARGVRRVVRVGT
jgi:Protein of unknown function (DUF3054)